MPSRKLGVLHGAGLGITPSKMSDPLYITTPIYYVNDKPHIGHAYTTLAADVLTRYHRLRGREVFFLTGTDEHGAKVAESAAKAGMGPKAFCDQYSESFQAAFAALNLRYDRFIRTTDSDHVQQVTSFIATLQERGAIYEGVYEGLYCTGCEAFYTETEADSGKCPTHQRPLIPLKEKNYFFRLTKYADEVERKIRSGEIRIEPETRRQETLGLFKQGLRDFSVSREKVTWGIPFPGDPTQTVYVWVDALQNYLTGIGTTANRERFDHFWPHVLHFMAKDILKFHAIYWPALLIAAGERPPARLFVHGFFTLNGNKMSKSLGNVIDPLALVEKFGADATRYLLLSQFPFGEDGDIQEERFAEKYNADLANTFGNLASRVIAMVGKYCGAEMPVASSTMLPLRAVAREAWEDSTAAFERLAFDRALKAVLKLMIAGNLRVDQAKPWVLAKTDPKELSNVLADLLLLLRDSAWLLAPFLPEKAQALADALGLGRLDDIRRANDPLPVGRSLRPLSPLFPRLS